MPAKDIIHEIVKEALQKSGWEVTDDPLILFLEEDNVAIDLGAEKERPIYLAVTESIYEKLLENAIIKKSIARLNIRMIIVDYKNKSILKWIK